MAHRHATIEMRVFAVIALCVFSGFAYADDKVYLARSGTSQPQDGGSSPFLASMAIDLGRGVITGDFEYHTYATDGEIEFEGKDRKGSAFAFGNSTWKGALDRVTA